MKTLTILCNIALFGFVFWALVDQYPHPNEPDVVPYAVLVVIVPILSAVVLFRARPSKFA